MFISKAGPCVLAVLKGHKYHCLTYEISEINGKLQTKLMKICRTCSRLPMCCGKERLLDLTRKHTNSSSVALLWAWTLRSISLQFYITQATYRAINEALFISHSMSALYLTHGPRPPEHLSMWLWPFQYRGAHVLFLYIWPELCIDHMFWGKFLLDAYAYICTWTQPTTFHTN